MAGKQQMPEINMEKEYVKLNPTDQHFIKKVEKLNTDRARGAKSLRGKNVLVGLALGAAVFSICILQSYF